MIDPLKLRNQLLLLAEKCQADAVKEGHPDAWLIGLARAHTLIDVAEAIAIVTKEQQP
jgi:hypothetical protein